MLETDCPFLSPVPHRGKRCEPAFLRETAQAVAALRHSSLEDLSAQTSENARRFFSKLKTS
jgi:TatD DNase family protein